MTDGFSHDVFLSHSSKDKSEVRALAERLRADGLRIWLADWELRPGDSIPAKIEDGLENSRVLVLCISANALGSDWAQLEAGTFRFRDPLNKKRRFIPLRLDAAPIKGSLAQFLYIKWLPESREREYTKLLEACRPPGRSALVEAQAAGRDIARSAMKLDFGTDEVLSYAFSPDGRLALCGTRDKHMRLYHLKEGRFSCVFHGHEGPVLSVALSADQRRALSGADDNALRLWDVKTGRCISRLEGHTKGIHGVAWCADRRFALSCACDNTLRLWDLDQEHCLRVFEGHTGAISALALCADDRLILSGAADNTIRVWETRSGRCLRVLEGHTDIVRSLAWSADQHYALSGSNDSTVRLWDIDRGNCLRVLQAHTNVVNTLAWCGGQRNALSGSYDMTLRFWDLETGRCLRVLEGHARSVVCLALSSDQRHAFSGDRQGSIRLWDLRDPVAETQATGSYAPVLAQLAEQVQYTNAKVLLVGESGAGKTGLSKALTGEEWQPSDSTIGAWATQWKLPVSSSSDGGDGVEREIWLWDFGGQADQRLIHQLYMDETALAVLVFDGQKEDLFETLGQWDRDLTRAARNKFSKLLVAGRVDAGGLRGSRAQIEAFRNERGYLQLLETSAKTNRGCEELKRAILDGIQWENIPWRSSPLLFKRLKEEIVRLKDAGRVLMRFNELRETLQLCLFEARSGEVSRFTDEELKAVVSLLAGPCVVWELKFGSWVLLQPEYINAYAQAVLQTMRDDEHERGCLLEERVLNGDLTFNPSMIRLEAEEERFVLLAMHQALVERGLCMREHTDKGPLLVFPSYYRRERPELVGHPAVLVSYRFSGFLDDIYATLVVRLHHTTPFTQDQLWRYAADFRTLTGKQLGVKMTRRSEGAAELEVYFDPMITVEEKIIFSKYVHEHLLHGASDVVRFRHYVCPHCGTPVGNLEVAMRKLKEGKRDILCINCDDPTKRIPLWDELEDLFARPEMGQRVRRLQEQSDSVLDKESKHRALVGDVISTVALAGQISREFSISDHGIDMEVIFKSDAGEVTDARVYLQLKSDDAYWRQRRGDGSEVFTIRDQRHVRFWITQAFPVLLVIRTAEGEVRWLDVRELMRLESDNGKMFVEQFLFQGQRLDVMSVRNWRERGLMERST